MAVSTNPATCNGKRLKRRAKDRTESNSVLTAYQPADSGQRLPPQIRNRSERFARPPQGAACGGFLLIGPRRNLRRCLAIVHHAGAVAGCLDYRPRHAVALNPAAEVLFSGKH